MKLALVPITVVVHLALPLIAYLSMRNQHSRQESGADVFRYAPGAAWFILIGAILMMSLFAAIAWTSRAGQGIPPLTFCVAEAATFMMGLYGVYLITLRIRVDDAGFTLASVWGKRAVLFDQIGSVTDKVTGTYRTLDVKTLAGKRVLYLGSSFIPDYAALVNLIQYGARPSAAPQAVRSNTNYRGASPNPQYLTVTN
jgi:hypothetical protein